MPDRSRQEIGVGHKFAGTLSYLCEERGVFLLIVIVAVLLLMVATGLITHWDKWEYWDPTLTLCTLAVGLTLFFNEATEHWEERLPKRLTVFYRVKGVTCMVCYEAHLAHEGDIRNWGQQIGLQLCDERLELSPYLDIQRLGIEVDKAATFTHFQAVIHLKKIPDGSNKTTEQKKKSEVSLSEELGKQNQTQSVSQLCKIWQAGDDGQEMVAFDAAERHVPRQIRDGWCQRFGKNLTRRGGRSNE